MTKPGDISPPVETSEGIYLIKLMGRREEEPRPFDEVRPQIQTELARQGAADYELQLREKVRRGVAIQINQGILDRCASNLAAAKPAAPPKLPKG